MAPSEASGRERVLERIRKALAMPGAHAPNQPKRPIEPVFSPATDVVEQLRKECAANHTECVETASPNHSAEMIGSILASLPPGPIFVQDAPELRRLSTHWSDRSLRWSSEGPPEEQSQATITLAEMVVAETGSILVSAGCGGRGASVVAPVHIALADAHQLVPTLEVALQRLHDHHLQSKHSYLCLITGSSRTADIEKMLVLGAHGPRRLVLLLTQSPD